MRAYGASWVVAGGLVCGLAVVLSGPAFLLWQAFRPQPWDAHTLGVRFESARYETAGIVFTYTIRNRTRRSIRLMPNLTRVVVRHEKDRPNVGYPSLRLPLELHARSLQTLEVRLDLPDNPSSASFTDPREVLANRLFGFVSPRNPAAVVPLSQAAGKDSFYQDDVDTMVQSWLEGVNGFELLDSTRNLKLVLPRAW